MALTENKPVKQVTGDFNDLPVAASTEIFEGAIVGLDASGDARALQGGDTFVGHCTANVDNSDGVAGDRFVHVLTGRYRLEVELSGVAKTDVGGAVHASDDNTLNLIGTGTAVGTVARYVATDTADVEFVPMA